MNNMIKIFESKEFGKVRTVVRNGETWWILKRFNRTHRFARKKTESICRKRIRFVFNSCKV